MAEQESGYIYILTNPSIPRLVKIGKTTRTVDKRVKEISAPTGVPTPYKVAHERWVVDCHAAEKEIHSELQRKRRNKKKEFFSLKLNEAIEVVDEICDKYSMNKVAENDIITENNITELSNEVVKSDDFTAPQLGDGLRDFYKNTSPASLIGTLLYPNISNSNTIENRPILPSNLTAPQLEDSLRDFYKNTSPASLIGTLLYPNISNSNTIENRPILPLKNEIRLDNGNRISKSITEDWIGWLALFFICIFVYNVYLWFANPGTSPQTVATPQPLLVATYQLLPSSTPTVEILPTPTVEIAPTPTLYSEAENLPKEGQIVWSYELKDLTANKSRWDIWKEVVEAKVQGHMSWNEFNEQVFLHNPNLTEDKSYFRPQEVYVLPQLK